jgi:hypothetical protein
LLAVRILRPAQRPEVRCEHFLLQIIGFIIFAAGVFELDFEIDKLCLQAHKVQHIERAEAPEYGGLAMSGHQIGKLGIAFWSQQGSHPIVFGEAQV